MNKKLIYSKNITNEIDIYKLDYETSNDAENDSSMINTDSPNTNDNLELSRLPTVHGMEEGKLIQKLYYPMTQNKKNNQMISALKFKRENMGKEDENKKTRMMITNNKNSKKLKYSISKDKKDDGYWNAVKFEDDFMNGDMDSTELDTDKLKTDIDYFLVDGDPTIFNRNWLRNRVVKQIDIGPSRGMFSGRDGGDGFIHGGNAGPMAEMTIERKVGRKFQTQGWK